MNSAWNEYPKTKPEMEQEVLIFCQGYDVTGKVYWSHYELAIFDKNVYDKKKWAFYQSISYRVEHREGFSVLRNAWIYSDVTHWTLLPEKPAKIAKEKRIHNPVTQSYYKVQVATNR